MADISFIQKCFNQWMKENPDSSYAEFRLLCKMWMHTCDDIYGKVRRYMEIDDKQKLNSLYGANIDYKKLYEERLKEKPKKQELSSVYGKFAKTPREMYDEGWCDSCDGNITECLKNNRCGGTK